ncbi:MAG: 5'/3'-nucleotidase SurE [Nitrospirae bacterium]|nr:5'/3'-nucleotidase SurE [Nitrospirota bacterium]
MLILVTNDDGIRSQGILVLARALKRLGDVYVAAPDRERTAAGHSLTLHKPLRIEALGPRTFSVSGTPTDCVNLAVNEILPRRPNLVVSGINRGGNLGDDVTYSGTVSAAMEGTLLGIPSIAVSQLGEERFHFETAARFAVRLARQVHRMGLPPDTLLNVNVPDLPLRGIKGMRVTCLGRRIFDPNNVIKKQDPRGKTYYWIGGNRIAWEERKDTDQEAVENGLISVTPVHLDLTNYTALAVLRDWENRLMPSHPRRRSGSRSRT